jgi:Protein of unknown function (DUF2738)
MSNKNTQLSDCINYDVASMIFAEAKESEFKPPGGGTTMKNFRISVMTKNVDGTTGELVFGLDESYCFGISTNTGKKDDTAGAAPVVDAGETFGHSLALCLTNKENPTPNQVGFVKTLERLIEHSKAHLVKARRSIREFELEVTDLKAMNKLIYRKRDKETGEVIDKYGPMIYPKLIETRKDGGKIYTEFYDMDDEYQRLIDPRTLIGTSCYVRPAIKVEGIWIGSGKHALQLKLYECGIRLPSRSTRSLLRQNISVRPQADVRVDIQQVQAKESDESEDGSDNEIQDAPAQAVAKPRTPSPVVQVPAKKPGIKRIPAKK